MRVLKTTSVCVLTNKICKCRVECFGKRFLSRAIANKGVVLKGGCRDGTPGILGDNGAARLTYHWHVEGVLHIVAGGYVDGVTAAAEGGNLRIEEFIQLFAMSAHHQVHF